MPWEAVLIQALKWRASAVPRETTQTNHDWPTRGQIEKKLKVGPKHHILSKNVMIWPWVSIPLSRCSSLQSYKTKQTCSNTHRAQSPWGCKVRPRKGCIALQDWSRSATFWHWELSAFCWRRKSCPKHMVYEHGISHSPSSAESLPTARNQPQKMMLVFWNLTCKGFGWA